MKLQKFEAENNHKAYLLVQAALGPDALIYSTKKTSAGIEILAGCEEKNDHEPQVEIKPVSTMPVHFNSPKRLSQLNACFTKPISHSKNITDIAHLDDYHNQTKAMLLRFNQKKIYNSIKKKLFELHFSEAFVHFALNKELQDLPTHVDVNHFIESILHKLIHFKPLTAIVKQKSIALVGMPGAGKSLTLAKIANYYLNSVSTEQIAYISTDINDINGVNHLLHFSNTMSIDIEYATSVKELNSAFLKFSDKKLILVDTPALNKNNLTETTELTAMLSELTPLMEIHAVLEANVKEAILCQIMPILHQIPITSCILSKSDQTDNLASVISICCMYQQAICCLTYSQSMDEELQMIEPLIFIEDLINI